MKVLASLILVCLTFSMVASEITTETETQTSTPVERKLNRTTKKSNSHFKFPRGLGKRNLTHECVLGARVYPYKYIGATQTMELKMEMKSNCMDFSTLNFFVLPFNTKMKLTKVVHPRKVLLSIYNRVYELNFSKPKRKGKGKLFYLEYQKVRILPSKWIKPQWIIKNNNVLLRTTSMDPFTKPEMDRLLIAKNPVLCKVSKDKKKMFCRI